MLKTGGVLVGSVPGRSVVWKLRGLSRSKDSFAEEPYHRHYRREEVASLDEGADIEVVCFDGIDYLAAEHVVASGLARPAPGGMRWLADQGAAAVDEHSGRLPSVAAAAG